MVNFVRSDPGYFSNIESGSGFSCPGRIPIPFFFSRVGSGFFLPVGPYSVFSRMLAPDLEGPDLQACLEGMQQLLSACSRKLSPAALTPPRSTMLAINP